MGVIILLVVGFVILLAIGHMIDQRKEIVRLRPFEQAWMVVYKGLTKGSVTLWEDGVERKFDVYEIGKEKPLRSPVVYQEPDDYPVEVTRPRPLKQLVEVHEKRNLS